MNGNLGSRHFGWPSVARYSDARCPRDPLSPEAIAELPLPLGLVDLLPRRGRLGIPAEHVRPLMAFGQHAPAVTVEPRARVHRVTRPVVMLDVAAPRRVAVGSLQPTRRAGAHAASVLPGVIVTNLTLPRPTRPRGRIGDSWPLPLLPADVRNQRPPCPHGRCRACPAGASATLLMAVARFYRASRRCRGEAVRHPDRRPYGPTEDGGEPGYLIGHCIRGGGGSRDPEMILGRACGAGRRLVS